MVFEDTFQNFGVDPMDRIMIMDHYCENNLDDHQVMASWSRSTSTKEGGNCTHVLVSIGKIA